MAERHRGFTPRRNLHQEPDLYQHLLLLIVGGRRLSLQEMQFTLWNAEHRDTAIQTNHKLGKYKHRGLINILGSCYVDSDLSLIHV